MNFFEDRKKYFIKENNKTIVYLFIFISFRFEDKESCRAYEEETECQLICYTKMLETM